MRTARGAFGLTPTMFSMPFSVNAIGFIGASQFAANLGRRFGMARMVFAAVAGYAAVAALLFALTAAGVDSLGVLVVPLFVAFAFTGLVIPTTMVLALDEHGPIAGMASAPGGLMIVVASFFFDGTALPMVTIIALRALGALFPAWVTLGRSEPQTRAAE